MGLRKAQRLDRDAAGHPEPRTSREIAALRRDAEEEILRLVAEGGGDAALERANALLDTVRDLALENSRAKQDRATRLGQDRGRALAKESAYGWLDGLGPDEALDAAVNRVRGLLLAGNGPGPGREAVGKALASLTHACRRVSGDREQAAERRGVQDLLERRARELLERGEPGSKASSVRAETARTLRSIRGEVSRGEHRGGPE